MHSPVDYSITIAKYFISVVNFKKRMSLSTHFITVCYSKREAQTCEDLNGTWFNQTCYNHTYIQSFDQPLRMCNASDCWDTTYNAREEYFRNISGQLVSPSEEYFK